MTQVPRKGPAGRVCANDVRGPNHVVVSRRPRGGSDAGFHDLAQALAIEAMCKKDTEVTGSEYTKGVVDLWAHEVVAEVEEQEPPKADHTQYGDAHLPILLGSQGRPNTALSCGAPPRSAPPASARCWAARSSSAMPR